MINKYILDTDDLLAYEFGLDESWLNFVVDNRSGFEPVKFYEKIDFIIGATSDDKLFSTIEQYESGFISSETAVKVLNRIEIGKQICIKTGKALDALTFIDSYKIESEKSSRTYRAKQTGQAKSK